MTMFLLNLVPWRIRLLPKFLKLVILCCLVVYSVYCNSGIPHSGLVFIPHIMALGFDIFFVKDYYIMRDILEVQYQDGRISDKKFKYYYSVICAKIDKNDEREEKREQRKARKEAKRAEREKIEMEKKKMRIERMKKMIQ